MAHCVKELHYPTGYGFSASPPGCLSVPQSPTRQGEPVDQIHRSKVSKHHLQVHEKRRNYLHLMLASERCIGAVIEIRHGARVRKCNTWYMYLKWVETTSTTGSACTETIYKSFEMTRLRLKGLICFWVHREFIATWPWQDHSIGHERGVICADGNDANALRKRRPCSPTCQNV